MARRRFGDIPQNVAELTFISFSDRERKFWSVSLSAIPLIPKGAKPEPVTRERERRRERDSGADLRPRKRMSSFAYLDVSQRDD
jgi:hypothetical protein